MIPPRSRPATRLRLLLTWLAMSASLLNGAAHAATITSGEILPADRRIQWQGNVGVVGGIPDLATIYATLTPSGGNDLGQIQAALRDCPANQVVKLAAGTFVLDGTLDYSGVGDGKVLRGSGRGATVLRWDSAGWPGCVAMRSSYSAAAVQTGIDLADDAVKGANTLTLSSVPSWIRPGHLYIIDQLDDPAFVTRGTTAIFEDGTDYRYQFATPAHGNRGLSQTVRVTAVSGSQVTLEIPLYYGFQKSRSARFWKSAYDPATSAPRSRCGIEDLTIRCAFTASDAHVIKMENCDSCWIRNIESDTVPGLSHIMLMFSYRCEIRDSYVHDARLYGPGQAYGISLFYSSCANLIENNVCKGLHASLQLNYGSSGNVVGYNYALQGRGDSGNDPSISFHGTHAYMNLCEGNYCQMPVQGDVVHGSSSHNVLFRNRIEGVRSGSDDDETPVEFDHWNRRCSVVGNVLGVPGRHSVYERIDGAPATPALGVIYKLGYVNPWGCDARLFDPQGLNATLRHLNWDAVSARVVADPSIPVDTLPASYYLAGKPAWFGDRPWPPFDPADPTGAVATAIPAGDRHVNGTGIDQASRLPERAGQP